MAFATTAWLLFDEDLLSWLILPRFLLRRIHTLWTHAHCPDSWPDVHQVSWDQKHATNNSPGGITDKGHPRGTTDKWRSMMHIAAWEAKMFGPMAVLLYLLKVPMPVPSLKSFSLFPHSLSIRLCLHHPHKSLNPGEAFVFSVCGLLSNEAIHYWRNKHNMSQKAKFLSPISLPLSGWVVQAGDLTYSPNLSSSTWQMGMAKTTCWAVMRTGRDKITFKCFLDCGRPFKCQWYYLPSSIK